MVGIPQINNKGKHMTLKEKVAARVANKQKALESQEEVLAENDSYVNYLVDMDIQSTQIIRLDAIINKLNGMKAIIAQDGTKYAVHCYPVSESIFGPVGARLMAIATIAGAMFTTERQVEFTALTGIPYLIALDASNKLGKPAYVTKANQYVAEVDYESDYVTALIAVTHALKLDIAYAKSITADKLDHWFASNRAKAHAKIEAVELTAQIDDEPFTLND